MLNRKFRNINRIPIHWFLVFNVLFTGILLLLGGIRITQDINQATMHSTRNLTQSDNTIRLIEQLIQDQLPLRKIVNVQKFLVNSFAYEFDLFVANEDGLIGPLKNSLNQMIDNYKKLESAWLDNLSKKNLRLLKAHINTTIGIYEEASEFDKVGFGEIYRLAQESKLTVNTLISLMEKIEIHLDQLVNKSKLIVSHESIITLQNDQSLLFLLKDITKKNRLNIIMIFAIVLIFQIVFYFFFKHRVSLFSQMTKVISEEGNLSQRIELNSKDKFGELAASFNDMLDNLQDTTISKSYLNNIIESMDDMVLVIDPNGIIKTANASSQKITKIKSQDLIGASIFEFISDKNKDIFRFILNSKRVVNLEKNIIHKNGSKTPVLFSAFPLIQEVVSDSEENIICVIRDITARIKIENEKIQAEKIAAEQSKYALIGQVAGKMAHDFNNVLGVIMGNVELSLITCKDLDLKKTLNLIFDQTIRGKNLTKNLIAFAKSQEPKQEFFKINEKINLVIDLLKKDLSGVDLIMEEHTGNKNVLADPGMIEHALVNLIQNSIHATSKTEHPKIIFRAYCTEKFVCFEIEDNGCGIPEEFQGNIYDPSFTLKGGRDTEGTYKHGIKGTGYGMANVKKYIDQHKGEISLESKFGSGTKFTIRLPITNKELSVEEKIEVKDRITCFERNILLIEDELAISGVQSRILTDDPCNHEVDIASSGEVAIKLFDKNEYDVISLDYILYGKMNGMDVYNHIRKKDSAIPILFVSGNIEFLEFTNELKIKDPNIEYLSKPCQNKDYVNKVNALLEKSILPHDLNWERSNEN